MKRHAHVLIEGHATAPHGRWRDDCRIELDAGTVDDEEGKRDIFTLCREMSTTFTPFRGREQTVQPEFPLELFLTVAPDAT